MVSGKQKSYKNNTKNSCAFSSKSVIFKIFNFFFPFYFCVCVVGGVVTCDGTHVEVREQPIRAGFFLPQCGPEDQTQSSCLTANTLTWTISPAPNLSFTNLVENMSCVLYSYCWTHSWYLMTPKKWISENKGGYDFCLNEWMEFKHEPSLPKPLNNTNDLMFVLRQGFSL